ncbi:hypothetical protein [Cellulosimicrobium sp. CpK407]|uniref:hypothetical protein n=1 Tax=Cellulosimicrobium sp. CpK407 TaxID=3229847 RepID=UPI003F384610
MTVTPLATAEVCTDPVGNLDPAGDAAAVVHVVEAHERLSRDARDVRDVRP